MSGLIKPDELKRIAEEVEMAKAREALEKRRKADHERNEFRDSFMTREIQREVFERLSRVVKSAAEPGEHEVLVMRFPSAYCTDGGRAINSFEPDWPKTLTGLCQEGARVLREGARAARLWGPGADHGLPRRHARRRRHLPALVAVRRGQACATGGNQ